MKDYLPWRLWQIRPHLYRLSARAPSLFASDAALSECITKVQLFFRTAKFHGKKSLQLFD